MKPTRNVLQQVIQAFALRACIGFVVVFVGLTAATLHPVSADTVLGLAFMGSPEAATLVTVDSGTGAPSSIGTLPGQFGVQIGVSALDAANHRIFFQLSDHLLAVDTQTGVVLSNPLLSHSLSFLEFDPSSSTLVGLAFMGSPEAATLVSVNATTGTLTPIASFPDFFGIQPGVSTLDAAGHQVFFQLSDRLFTVNTQTGAALSNPLLEQNLSFLEFDPGSGTLVGLTFLGNPEAATVVTIAPGTGSVTPVVSLPDFFGVQSGVSALKTLDHHLFFQLADRLFTVDVQTGTVLTNPQLAHSLSFIISANPCGNGVVQIGVEQCDDGGTVNGDGCSSECLLEERTVTDTVSADTPVTTDTTNQGATPSQPLQAAVTPSTGGTVTATISGNAGATPSGFQLLTGVVQITAPPGTANDPLVLVFQLDASVLPFGEDPLATQISKDGIIVPDCTGTPGVASPDPCVADREILSGGDLQITVLSSTASEWGVVHWQGCELLPQTACRRPTQIGAASLQLKNNSSDARDKLLWQWDKGSATPVSAFGDPITGTAYSLCVYDASGLKLRALAPAAGVCGEKPCWKAAAKSFTYTDREMTPEGLSSVQLKAGAAGKASLKVQGKGVNLAMPGLPLTLPVTAQLQNSTGQCWEAQYNTSGVIKNDAKQFKAKGN